MGNSSRSISQSIKSIIGAAVCCIGFSCSVLADITPNRLMVLGRVGETVSTSTYFKQIEIQDGNFRHAETDSLIKNMKAGIGENMFFPLMPNNLSPGRQGTIKFDEPKQIQPFAVVGSDPLSRQWLSHRYSDLKMIKPLIFIIEAQSFEAVRELANEYSDLSFAPSSGNIGSELGVSHYPFLITADGIYQ